MAGVERFELPDDGVRVRKQRTFNNLKIALIIFDFTFFRVYFFRSAQLPPNFQPNKKDLEFYVQHTYFTANEKHRPQGQCFFSITKLSNYVCFKCDGQNLCSGSYQTT